MKRFLNIFKNQDGQALMLIAVMMVAIMGFVALSVDVGRLYLTRIDLQKTADAAALAGAKMLPGEDTARNLAITYAGKNMNNESDLKSKIIKSGDTYTASNTIDNVTDTVTATTPYNSHKTQIEVTCTRTVHYTFAKVLGWETTNVTAKAVADNTSKYDGEALPFLNIGYTYDTPPDTNGDGKPDLIVWSKVTSGDKGTLYDFETKGSGSNTYFELDYGDGLTIKQGFDNGLKGLDGSKLKDGVDAIFKDVAIGTHFYVFSLNTQAISDLKSGKLVVTDKKGDRVKRGINPPGLQPQDIVDKDDLVLLEVALVSYDSSNNHNIHLDYTGTSYDVAHDILPPGGSITEGIVKLVK